MVQSYPNIGGFIGYGEDCSINACYADVDIKAIGSNNNQRGDIGGFVGKHYGTITSCFSLGGIITPSSNNDAIGGFTGENGGDMPSGNFWDIETSGLTWSSGAVGKTTSELQTPTSDTDIYNTWDPDLWDFGTTTQYPALINVVGGIEKQRQ